MADDFDPYYKWLAIPPPEQPPNHYRLLGVPEFEPDGDVIACAADRQMSHLRDLSSGPHVEHAQRLLNEVARARLCLLSAASKATYDVQLGREFADKLASMRRAEALSRHVPLPM